MRRRCWGRWISCLARLIGDPARAFFMSAFILEAIGAAIPGLLILALGARWFRRSNRRFFPILLIVFGAILLLSAVAMSVLRNAPTPSHANVESTVMITEQPAPGMTNDQVNFDWANMMSGELKAILVNSKPEVASSIDLVPSVLVMGKQNLAQYKIVHQGKVVGLVILGIQDEKMVRITCKLEGESLPNAAAGNCGDAVKARFPAVAL